MTIPTARRRGLSTLAGALSVTLLLAACGTTAESEGTLPSEETSPTEESGTPAMRVFEADNGSVEIPVRPQRVVAVANAVTPVLKFEVEPVGVSQIIDPESLVWLEPGELAAHDAATDVGSASELDFELIASLDPDLITILLPQPVIEQVDTERLESIAPTIFIANNALEWDVVNERLADALDRTAVLDRQRDAYEQTIARIQADHADIISSTSFVAVDRWDVTDQGVFAVVYSLCHAPALEAGLSLPSSAEDEASEYFSFELLGDLAEYDAIIYPLDPDGETKEAFVPVTESGLWQSLPAVTEGRTLGVHCVGLDSFDTVLTYLESLDEALGALPQS